MIIVWIAVVLIVCFIVAGYTLTPKINADS